MLIYFVLFYSSCSFIINEDYSAQFVNDYNSGNYSKIYDSFHERGKLFISYEDLAYDLKLKKTQYGNIIAYVPKGIFNRKGIKYEYRTLLAFEKNNSTGVLVQLQGWNKIMNISIWTNTNWQSLPSLINNDSRLSFALKINDTKISYQDDVAVPIGYSDMTWILLEYASQVAKGNISGQTTVSRGDVAKYYLDGFDVGFMRSQVLQNDNFTLDALVAEALNSTNWAAQEYFLDILGVKNVSDRKSSLGLNSSTSYPVSVRYGFATNSDVNATQEAVFHQNLTTDSLKVASYGLRKASCAQLVNAYITQDAPGKQLQALETMFGNQIDSNIKTILAQYVNSTQPLLLTSNSLKSQPNSYTQITLRKQLTDGTLINLIAGIQNLDAKELKQMDQVFDDFVALISGSADYRQYVLSWNN